jgi:hypothetical protein
MTSTSVCLLSKNLSFTPYDVNWVPKSSRVCIVGATNQGTGRIAAYGLEGKQLELKQEVRKERLACFYLYI